MNPLLYMTAFGLGAAHALEPGHGKMLVVAYLGGAKRRLSDALVLGLLVTLFHTLSVFALGILGVSAARLFFKSDAQLLAALQVVSGLIIMGIGLNIFWRRFVQDKGGADCECHLSHVHHDGHAAPNQPARNWKEIVSLGFACGISPCPTAVAALIASISLGGFVHLSEALLYLLTFSLGLGTILVVLGSLLIGVGNRFAEQFVNRDSRLPVYISLASAALIIGVGLYLTLQPIFFPQSIDRHEQTAFLGTPRGL